MWFDIIYIIILFGIFILSLIINIIKDRWYLEINEKEFIENKIKIWKSMIDVLKRKV
jgi:hypothetical protein